MLWTGFWTSMLIFFIIIPLLMIWLFAIVDLFMRPDLSGVAKALWLVGIVILPLIGTLVYFVAKPAEVARPNYQSGYDPVDAERGGTYTET